MQDLQTLIDLLEKGRNLHISILDLTGILNHPETKIAQRNVIHSKPICDIAKSTQQGYLTCLNNKARANRRAIECKRGFCGHCVYGIFEYALPVVIGQRVSAIIYVGNAVIDIEKTVERLKKACAATGVSEEEMKKHLNSCEKNSSEKETEQIAEIVADYLKLLYSSCEKTVSDDHWLVTLMKHYANENLSNEIHLRDIAILYDRNEKYIGRLFKSKVGMSFSEYCNEQRLKKAERLLRERSKKVIDIASECGFENVTYFNRLFKKKYGVPPSGYIQ